MDLNKSLKFLVQLGKNNNRRWFNEHKALYMEAKKEFERLIDLLIPAIKNINPEVDVTSAGQCLFRIFRDIRFSHDKSPYKTNFSAFIAKGGRKSPCAGRIFF